MVKLPPQLDPIRLELAAGLYDSAVWQLEVYCDDAQRYCLTVEDAARLQAMADLIGWHAENLRRRALTTRATNQMYTNYLAGEVAVCDDAAGFAASMTPPQRPPIPGRLETIDFDLLAPARALFEEAHKVLSRGGESALNEWAADQARAFYTWCHPPVNWR
ncbi:Uncharacterised protein [Mycobacteroides abscessus subsp. abscessus]|uniref:Uncharacterized protein n=1 Tax=Mycobacteroides abscessus subsp. massiliense TaxID=1962118 RepID=A0A1T8KT11_9MYCO|nr:hypothetical protein [Mycobacteroides abscessus]MEC4903172.1 hypothetical protein [Mycobacteroides chelonae]EIV69087.1 hypothetical protein MMCCUG48898_0024 [Mycobacteroides abscessus subsp. massiliense CCUG 48898 = JCM 15300]ORA88337.1 hypothetical protein BST32_17500 [Mycobacteroides abscessus subsp. massiliense]SIE12774.1 Uncharacterised protein [Mycobacteroides abscessus subsp. abscessus]SIF83188.1 Uncharacterised protein [Mycobacteroides abscessus subsp. abscessus]